MASPEEEHTIAGRESSWRGSHLPSRPALLYLSLVVAALSIVVVIWISVSGKLPVADRPAAKQAGRVTSTPVAKRYADTKELYYRIDVAVSYSPSSDATTERVWKSLEGVNDIFNDYRKGSEIYKINRSSTVNNVSLSPRLASAFLQARKAHELSEGVFDITCGPIRQLWRAAEKEKRLPTDQEIAVARGVCGTKLLTQEKDRLSIAKPGVHCDFGGIVKGIAADDAIAILKAGGAKSALVQIGGETVAFGLSEKGRPHRIGIHHPVDIAEIWCVIQDPGTGLSCSTSGNYENPIVINGEKFYHIFDPRTGRPAKTNVLSVSVAFPTTGKNWLADSMSTTGTILGPEKTFAILKELGGEALFLIWKGGKINEVTSPGWKRFCK